MKSIALAFELDRDEIRGHHVPAQEIHGTVRLDGDDLVIEFGLTRGPAEGSHTTVRIALADIERVSWTGGALKSPRLLLEVSREDVLANVPWSDGCQCVMRFRRAEGQRLRELIEEIEVRLARVRTRDEP